MKQLAIFALLACAPALYAAEPPGQEAVLCEDVKKPFFSVACDHGTCMAAPARRESAAPVFRLDKQAGVKRVFVLGESAATLLRNGPDDGAAPRGLEILNCGMGGYESWRIQGVLNEVLEYKPDLIVILSGNNEGGTWQCPGLRYDLQRRWRRLLELFYSIRMSREDAAVRATLHIQESRLDAMAAAAARHKVPLLLCALPANLAGLGPSGAPPVDKPEFLAAMNAYGRKDLPGAEAAFRSMLARSPRDLFARFYLARTLQAAGKLAEARTEYLKVVSLDPRQDRASAERNAMLRRVAARHGAGVCALDELFYALAPGGIPDLAQFADGVHWRPAYDRLAWKEVAADGRAMGLAWLPEIKASAPGALNDEEIRRTFSYALSYLDNSSAALLPREQAAAGFLSERVLDLLEFIEKTRPGLPEKAAASQKTLDGLLIRNFWSQHTAARLAELRAPLTAHLAELRNRRRDFAGALALADKAYALDGSKPYFLLVRAKALAGLGRLPEARGAIASLYHLPALRAPAAALAAACGLRMPGSPVPEKDRAAAAETARRGLALFEAGDLPGAEAALAAAAALDPSDAEAQLSLCSARYRLKEYDKALEACDFADIAADAVTYPEARRRLISEALLTKGIIREALGRRAEAAADLRKALQDPPKAWPLAAAAGAELEKLEPALKKRR